MSRFELLRDHLPSLYRPEDTDTGLVVQLLRAVGDSLDAADQAASQVLQAHWFAFADRALYSPYVLRARQLQGLPPPNPGDGLFRITDILRPADLVVRLRDAPDALTQHIQAHLASATRQQVAAYTPPGPPSSALLRPIVEDLNALLQAGPLYTDARFAEVTLSEATRALIGQPLHGGDLLSFNRRLLEEAYPTLLATGVLPEVPIHDLARLAALLLLPPWQDPPSQRETVEAYRLRIQRMVALYKEGLGTLGALRRVVEATLPLGPAAPAEQQDRPFFVEEFAPLGAHLLPIRMPGPPEDLVGPLMRWTINNTGQSEVVPTVYIQGQAGNGDTLDATREPIIERYAPGSVGPGVGLCYRRDVPPGQTLRLRPTSTSWLVGDDRLQRSEPSSGDATAPGPWSPAADAPPDRITALAQTQDHTLWATTQAPAGASSTLWRYDGQAWTKALGDLPPCLCLAEGQQALQLGTARGALHVPLYPLDGNLKPEPDPATLNGPAVYALFRAADGQWWAATEEGADWLAPDGTLTKTALTNTPVYAISQDNGGTLLCGSALGVFAYQPSRDDWYWYSGAGRTEQEADWNRFDPADTAQHPFPQASQVFLPPVHAVLRGLDESLWLGTDHGIARYVARSVGGLTYETYLEAFPDLTLGPVFTIQTDAAGLVWFGTDRGLLRYDGRDWWQFQADRWVQLGRADQLYAAAAPSERGAWRFDRATSAWQRFNDRTRRWDPFAPPVRTEAEAAVRLIGWTDGVAAELGEWDGQRFTNPTPVPPTDLMVRYKPSEERIVDGGIPSIPRLPVGVSVWRYLAHETLQVAEPSSRPAWTIEGRLLPPPPPETVTPGRYEGEQPALKSLTPHSEFDRSAFAFNPAARVWFAWEERSRLTVLARLKQRRVDEQIDPAILDRVWLGIQQVRPAGVRAMLAVEEDIVRGTDDG